MNADLAKLLVNRPAGARLLLGQVVSSGALDVEVFVGGQTTVRAPRLRSYTTPLVGDVVVLIVDGPNRVCLGATSSSTSPPAIEYGPPPAPMDSGTVTFPAIDAATLRGSWRTDTQALYQGNDGAGLNLGAWFYGEAISETLADAEVVEASVWVHRTDVGDAAALVPTLVRHQLHRRTAAPIPVGASFTGPPLLRNAGATIAVPVAVAQALVNAAGGLALYVPTDTPYLGIRGLDTDGRSGALTITWRR